MLTARDRLAVWGDPIAHSRSPQLHAAAYRVLGLDWQYGKRQVAEAEFGGVLADLDDSWRGLSLTFPLKGAAFAASVDLDRRAQLTGAVNTLLLTADGPRGFNTDIGGLVQSLREAGVDRVERGRIVGAGATATSALVALGELGASHVEVVARRPDAASHLVALGDAAGIAVEMLPFDTPGFAPVDVTIATLPGDAEVPRAAADALAASGGLLLDVVYGHWPTTLAGAWHESDARAISGLGMLLHQAILQIRIFVAGDPEIALHDEQRVLDAMRSVVVGD